MRTRQILKTPWAQGVVLALLSFPLVCANAALANTTQEPTVIAWSGEEPILVDVPRRFFHSNGELSSGGEEAEGPRGHLAIDGVEVADQPVDGGKVVTISGVLPTPCHRLGWEIAPSASADGVLQIQAWSIGFTDKFCVQALQPFSAQISLGSILFDTVSVNGVLASLPAPTPLRSETSPAMASRLRGGGPGPSITATPGPLPVAAALAGWQCARRLRRRCKPLEDARANTL